MTEKFKAMNGNHWIWFNRCAIFIQVPALFKSAWDHELGLCAIWAVMIWCNALAWWTRTVARKPTEYVTRPAIEAVQRYSTRKLECSQ